MTAERKNVILAVTFRTFTDHLVRIDKYAYVATALYGTCKIVCSRMSEDISHKKDSAKTCSRQSRVVETGRNSFFLDETFMVKGTTDT